MSETQDKYAVTGKAEGDIMYMPTGYNVSVTDRSPAALMLLAIEKGLDLDKVEKAMFLQERWEANEARKAYHEAMASFKANPPEIDKDRHVKFSAGNKIVEYNHASLANVTQKINAALSLHGLSAGWKVEQGDKIKVTCTITHRLGHFESTSLSAGPDDSGAKNSIQAIGSTISYLERYTILALTGLATHEMDDDSNGAAAPPQHISTDQAVEITNLLIETKSDEAKFLKYIGSETIEQMLAKDYEKAIIALKKKQSAGA